jgi:hypothetical protein
VASVFLLKAAPMLGEASGPLMNIRIASIGSFSRPSVIFARALYKAGLFIRLENSLQYVPNAVSFLLAELVHAVWMFVWNL